MSYGATETPETQPYDRVVLCPSPTNLRTIRHQKGGLKFTIFFFWAQVCKPMFWKSMDFAARHLKRPQVELTNGSPNQDPDSCEEIAALQLSSQQQPECEWKLATDPAQVGLGLGGFCRYFSSGSTSNAPDLQSIPVFMGSVCAEF